MTDIYNSIRSLGKYMIMTDRYHLIRLRGKYIVVIDTYQLDKRIYNNYIFNQTVYQSISFGRYEYVILCSFRIIGELLGYCNIMVSS
jgi:hypothetical protein